MTAVLHVDRPVDLADRFRERIWSARDRIESDRGLPDELLDELVAAGAFRLFVPRHHGGAELDLITALRVVEDVASIDGSVGWLLLANTGGLCTTRLADEVAREVLGARSDAVIGGAVVPTGVAHPVPCGYIVEGRWRFASGVAHSDWMMLGCTVSGRPEARIAFVRRDQLTIEDTWHDGGLRGTGSHDIVVEGTFVPAELTFSLADEPLHPGPLYRFPIRCLGAAGIAAVCIGIARGAIDAFVDLARTKTPTASSVRLLDRASAQASLARAEALVRSSRAWLHQLVADAWSLIERGGIERGGEVAARDHVLIRLAATDACHSAAAAVDLVQRASGGAALFADLPIERAFRDIHAATQHFSVQDAMYEMTGRALLGGPCESM